MLNNIFEWVFLFIFLTVSHCIFCGLLTNNGKIETFPITFHTGMIFASLISHWQSFKRKQERTYSLSRSLRKVARAANRLPNNRFGNAKSFAVGSAAADFAFSSQSNATTCGRAVAFVSSLSLVVLRDLLSLYVCC